MQLQEKPLVSSDTVPLKGPLGLYFHIPFCSTVCEFCNFYTEALDKTVIGRYLEGMRRSFDVMDGLLEVDTVFWGGGTPGLLTPKQMEILGKSMLSILAKKPLEWSIELAPANVTRPRLKMLKALGVTRLSMGVQSFDDAILEKLGRQHYAKQAVRAYEMARDEGFENINLDLMFALPGQSLKQWESDLLSAVALGPEHISTYCLTFEEDTALWLRLQRGETTKKSPEDEAEFYKEAWALLEAKGYAQYEISNFAKKGYECIHNINTWEMHEWLGFGPAAASQSAARRWRNVASVDEWYAGVLSGENPAEDEVFLTHDALVEDCLVFGLRMNRGVDTDALAARFPAWSGLESLKWVIEELAEEGLLIQESSRIRLSLEGRLLADRVALRIMEVL